MADAFIASGTFTIPDTAGAPLAVIINPAASGKSISFRGIVAERNGNPDLPPLTFARYSGEASLVEINAGNTPTAYKLNPASPASAATLATDASHTITAPAANLLNFSIALDVMQQIMQANPSFAIVIPPGSSGILMSAVAGGNVPAKLTAAWEESTA